MIELIKHLDPDELVEVLGLTTEELVDILWPYVDEAMTDGRFNYLDRESYDDDTTS